ncbi:MAG TPA: hypothetical protein VGC85_03525 [Chthoniobacterales bacterium]|jgi:hypothetical protein
MRRNGFNRIGTGGELPPEFFTICTGFSLTDPRARTQPANARVSAFGEAD